MKLIVVLTHIILNNLYLCNLLQYRFPSLALNKLARIGVPIVQNTVIVNVLQMHVRDPMTDFFLIHSKLFYHIRLLCDR